MNESKHTPGPWSAEPQEDGHAVAYRINDQWGYEIAVTSGRDGRGEEEANADLISVAPLLLLAAKEALGALEWCGGSTDFQTNGHARLGWVGVAAPAIKGLVAAIAKAEGQS